MKITTWFLVIMNLTGISLLLMIPIFNLWYAGILSKRNWFKECVKWHKDLE